MKMKTMNLQRIWKSSKTLVKLNASFSLNARSFSTAPVLSRLGGWRMRNNLPAKGKEYGPLTDLPDWSYADGRPAPISENQKKRILRQKSYCEQIIKMTQEVDKCFELNAQRATMEEAKRQKAVKNRLKTKGKSDL